MGIRCAPWARTEADPDQESVSDDRRDRSLLVFTSALIGEFAKRDSPPTCLASMPAARGANPCQELGGRRELV